MFLGSKGLMVKMFKIFFQIIWLTSILTSITYAADADLELTEKSSPSPDPVNIGQEVTFVTRLKNLGPDTAKPNQVIEFTYNQDIDIVSVSVTSNGVTCSPTSGSLSQGSKITCTKTNNTNKGGIRDITIKAEPTQRGTLKQVATISSSGTNDPHSSNDTLTSSVTVVQRTGTCTGCDCSYDTGNNDTLNDSSPGVKITQLDGVATDTQKCISGVSEDLFFSSDNDYYYFDVGADGNITINTSSPNNHNFHLEVTSDGSVVYPDTSNTFNHHVTFSVSTGDQVILFFKETGNDTDQYEATISATFASMPPILSPIPDQSAPLNMAFSLDLSQYVTPTNGDPITAYHLSCTIPGLSFDTSTGILSGTPTQTGTTSCTASAEDKDGTSNTQTFQIDVTDQTVEEGVHDFTLINPPSTRNIIGNFAVLGNTVECITTSKYNYNAACSNNKNYTNNNYMVRYIDIDNDPDTWNSSSSNFTLPASSYDNSDGDGILWAGLFWQGSVNAIRDANDHYPQRRASLDSNGGWSYTDITSSQSTSIPNSDADKVWIKIDNDANYTKVRAKTLYYNKKFGNKGGYYAAFTDITTWLKGKQLGVGKHTLTLANLTTNEGREIYHGHYGGWTMVVIYKEKGIEAKTRNISIYNGYADVDRHSGVTSVKISGFRLPSSGQVNASFSAFAGEGEYKYGEDHARGEYDRMVISRHADLSHPDTMPGATDPDNIFDAVLANVDRDHTGDNDLSGNNCGIDVENYDVSSIMTDYRNADRNINTVYIGLSSSRDYITPSMMAFSAELYAPELCYDYVTKLNEFVIPYKNHTAYRSYAKQGDELSVSVAIWDITGDIDPKYVSIGLPVKQRKGHITPIMNPDKAYYTIPNGNTLLPTDYASMSTPNRPVITIGNGRTADVGGIISHDQRYFAKYYFEVQDTNTSMIEGDYNIEVNATFNYGSGDFWQIMGIKRCEQNLTYSPTWVQFNVEQAFGNTPPSDPTAHYSLPTRVAGKDFNYDVASYGKDSNGQYTLPISANGVTVDVEMIDIGDFDDNGSYFKCGNSDPNIIIMPGEFAYFDNNRTRLTETDIHDLKKTTATRNTTFRMWLLTDENGTLLTSDKRYEKNENDHYAEVYDKYYSVQDINGLCSSACTKASGYNYTSSRYHNIHYGTDPNAVGCYACLRDKFAQPYCARDNFAIRPKAIRVDVGDKGLNETLNSKPIAVNINRHRTPKKLNKDVSIAAEYPYELNMTTVDIRDNKVNGYTTLDLYQKQTGITSIPDKRFSSMALVKFEGDAGKCADTTHTSLNPRFANGFTSSKLNTTNAGTYSFEIWDSNWTTVDRAVNNPYKTLFSNACKNNIDPACNDCILGTTTVDANDADKVGCTFSSELKHLNGNIDTNYTKLDLKINPYSFNIDLGSIQSLPSTKDTKWVYMNDLSDYRLLKPGAAVQLDINVTAKGAHDGNLTNFIFECAAEDTVFWLDRNMSRPENTIATENTADPVYFQQWLDADYGNTQPVQDTSSGLEMNATLPKENYLSDQNGTAYHVRINYNFKKPYNDFVNPVIVDFQALHAASLDAFSYADHKSKYVPEGNVTVDENKTFLYAKVAPKIGDEYITTYDSNYTTFLRVDTFCKNTLYINCNTLQNASILGPQEESNNDGTGGAWYRVSDHNASTDGQINSLNANITGITELPISSILFDNNGSTSGIKLTYPIGRTRPGEFVLTITPDLWLRYKKGDFEGLPTFSIHYLLQGLRWKGEGNTGHVITIEPYQGKAKFKRMNW